MNDGDFADGHHLLPEAAADFSLRFAREILRPSLKLDCNDADRRYVAGRPTGTIR